MIPERAAEGAPAVTVLMAVHNGLPYLSEAVESVLNQTLTDFELLIIDDASTDESVACIRSYPDPRIRLFCNESNLGTSGTINKGLALARAPYIARLDQDDVSLPKRLEEQWTFLRNRPDLTIACSWEYGIDSGGRKMRAWRTRVENYGEFLGPLLLGKCPIWHPSIMFRRESMIAAGGYDGTYSPAEDFELSMRLAMRRYHAGVVPRFLVSQRQHGERQSVKREDNQRRVARRVHDDMVKTFCRSPEAEGVALLLRMESEFWRRSKSRKQIGAVLAALDEMMKNMRRQLDLTSEEYGALTRVVYRRLGPGVKLGRRLAVLPSVFFYPIFIGLSPLLVSGVRKTLSYGYGKVRELTFRLSWRDEC